ncbi:MAG TPA: cytochrome P450 [Thermoleophilaceae bacterium]|nr:cytochrome P450 [Thermoleophilaceae bacterium]
MAVAPPPAVPSGVLGRVRSDVRTQLAARGGWPPGELSFSMRRTREFERKPLPLLLRLREEHGPVFSIRLLYQPIVFAIGPEANHYMTVSHASNFRWRDGGMGDLIPLLGDGLLTTDGDYHRRARRIMLPAFHRERLAASGAIMAEEAERAVSGWRPGEQLDLYMWTRRLALRIAMRALFGFDPDRDARDARMAAEFEEALGYWGRDYALQMLRGPGSPWRAMNRAKAKLDRVIFAEIARRRARGERGLDILSLLLDASDEDGSRLSDRELRDQVMTLLFAGHDTTTSTVTFMFYELARNPGELPADEAQLDMVVDETLRMYPPAWIGPRRSIEPFELCGARVPGGVMVNYCSWASHHLPEVFPEPWSFRPSRFAPEAKAALPKGAYVPFGGGSRTCIGMRFGQLEVKEIARAILHRFALDLADPSHVPRIRQMPTLSPRGGLPVVVRARD